MADFHPVLERVTEAISIQMQVINVMHISRATTEQREVSSVQVSSSLISTSVVVVKAQIVYKNMVIIKLNLSSLSSFI